MSDDNRLVPRQITFSELVGSAIKASLNRILPFSGYGANWGSAAIYSSDAAWDRTIDLYGGNSSASKYISKVGDLSQSSLMCAAIRFVGNALPEANLTVKQSTGKKGQSEVVEGHELVKLWNRPNEFYSGSTLKKGIAFSWVLNSQAYVIKIRSKNKGIKEPMQLWWEPHWTIRPVWPTDGTEFIAHYEVNRNGRWYPIPVEDVIHFRDGIDPYNQRTGFSTVPSILREVFGDNEAANYYGSLMGGAAVPPFLVALDPNVSATQPELDALERTITAKTSGDKRGRPIIVKGGKAYKLAFSPRELDLRESRYMPEERFCAVMGIPAVVMELGSGQAHSIYNNVNMAMERAWRSYICPLLTHIEEELTVQLLDDYEDVEEGKFYCEHDLSKVQALQENETEKATRLAALYSAGGITRQEFRSGMGYSSSDPANEDADKVFAVLSAQEEAVHQQTMAQMELEKLKIVEAGERKFLKEDEEPNTDSKEDEDEEDETKSWGTIGANGDLEIKNTLSWLRKIRVFEGGKDGQSNNSQA